MKKYINCCDILNTPFFMMNGMDELLDVKFPEVERVYIGSYFCSQYFMHMGFIGNLSRLLDFHQNCKVTLVIPIISQKNIRRAKFCIRSAINCLPVDEVTVNDVGMLQYIYTNFGVQINLGRLFFKDERDFRMPSYYENTLHPAELDALDFYDDRFQIQTAELDPMATKLDLRRTDTDVDLAIHSPFCYLTTGNICKYASIDKPIAEKFHPNSACSKDCQKTFETYLSHTAAKENKVLYRIGRAVYFDAQPPETINGNFSREIYFPFQEVLELTEKRYDECKFWFR